MNRLDVRRTAAIIAACGLMAACGSTTRSSLTSTSPAPAPTVAAVCTGCVTLTDGATVAVDVDVQRGGAIISATAIAGAERSPEMVDNTSPTGRQWQAALWNGTCTAVSDQALCAGATNCLNPTQAGDACERLSGGDLLMQSPGVLTVRTHPLDFSASTRRPIRLETTLSIVAPGVLRLDYHAVNESDQPFGFDAWQNLPVLFTPPVYSQVTSYLPDGGLVHPTRQTDTVTDDAWRSWSPDWIARSTDDGWTVLVYVPGPHPWSIGFPGPQSPGAGWMQPLQWLELAPGAAGDATAWLTVGRTLEEARQRAGAIR